MIAVSPEDRDQLASQRVAGSLPAFIDFGDRAAVGQSIDELIRAVIGVARDALVVVGPSGQILVANSKMADLFGYDPSELIGQPIEALVPNGFGFDHERHRKLLGRTRDKAEFPIEVTFHSLPSAAGALGVADIRDMTDFEQRELILAYEAYHDPLTGLANRTLLMDRLEHALARAKRSNAKVGVFFLDVDEFKVINDTMGHSAGDELLRVIASRLQEIVRGADTLARFGGDEFVIVADGIDDEEALTVIADRLRSAFSRTIEVGGDRLSVSTSIGVAVAAPGDHAEMLLRDADAAMYRAKAQGPGCCVVFDESMRTAGRSGLESILRSGIADGQFALHYQPVIDLKDNVVVGVEALIRWHHPTRGLLLPHDFLPLAEETGLIVDLGREALRMACQDGRALQEQNRWSAPLCIGVNISVRQLLRADFVALVEQALDASRLDPDTLWLEITESRLLTASHAATHALRALKELGVRIAVDDFGTGYSPLTYLKNLPADSVKIDKSFVAGFEAGDAGREDRAIVRSVVDLAHGFGLLTVAEGVETEAQLTSLRHLGCAQGQGYYWSTPLPAGEISRWIDSHRRAPTDTGETRTRPTSSVATVLIVEDQATLRTLLRLAFETEPAFAVVGEAADGRDAIALARYHQPSVVLLDLALPGLGGLEAIPFIRAVSPRSQIVVTTGIDDADIENRARQEGVAAFWIKGDPESLLSTLRDLTGR